MTVDTFHPYTYPSLTNSFTVFKQAFVNVTRLIGYAVLLAAYVSVFLLSISSKELLRSVSPALPMQSQSSFWPSMTPESTQSVGQAL